MKYKTNSKEITKGSYFYVSTCYVYGMLLIKTNIK